MDSFKKSIMRNKSRSDIKTNISSSYLPLSPGKYSDLYKNEIQLFIKDIEDLTKSDLEAWSKYKNQNFAIDLKLILKEYSIGQNEYSLLHLAAKNCRKNFCQFLIKECRIDKDIKCKNKTTPLHLLIRSNIFYKKDYDQNNPIFKTKFLAFKETFGYLLENGANVNHQDESESTCLHYAVAKSNYGAVLVLIDTPGININVKFFSIFFSISTN
ncbi:unnamed protein product [Brachionus calyciflorus]|uniref:Uncharacterized protein n=1 Tax=Brachionus calyciflorus TaxID=104777 RepID=A0A813WAS5_9BILA|nr:unnamed protein product [Brachionus calyciflorus]